jgi:molybdopterin converting factor small subunit
MTSSTVKKKLQSAAASTREAHVRLFAHARELAGGDSVCVSLSEQATIGELRKALLVRLPAAAELLRRSMFAIDNEYVSDEVVLPDESGEIACIPPVSGG